MVERLNNTWQEDKEDKELQARFWELFPTGSLDINNKRQLHGEIYGRFGANYLRNNKGWLE